MKHVGAAAVLVAVVATTGVVLGLGPRGPAADRETTAVDPPVPAVTPAPASAEPGAVLVRQQDPPASDDPGRAVCPGVEIRSLDVDVRVPCGVGAEIVDLEYPGDNCVTVSYRESADAEVAVETFCEAPDARSAHGGGADTEEAPAPGGGNGA